MKIDTVTLNHLRMPLRLPFETSFGRSTERDCILIRIGSEGLVGLGECVADHDPGYAYETTATAWHIIHDFIAPKMIGKDIQGIEDYRQRMAPIRGHPMAKAGIEMALWDLRGKIEGCCLQRLIGGQRQSVEVGVSVGIQESKAALITRVESYLGEGYQRIKIKIKPGRDVLETSAVREAFPDTKLQVDANSAYDLDSAQTLKPLDDMDLLLIEQPLAEDDIWDHAKLQKGFKTALCLDESILSARHARCALEMAACRVINIKAGRVGGLREAIAVHDLCKDRSVPVWCGGMLETGIGRAANLALASLPGFTLPGDLSATARYYERDITHERFVLNPDSSIDVPAGNGLGVTLDLKNVKKYTLRQETVSL